MILHNEGTKRRKSIRLLAIMATLLLIMVGAAAVNAGTADDETAPEQKLDNKNGCMLVSEIKETIGRGVPVQSVSTNTESHNTYDEIKPGECKRIGPRALHIGDVLSINQSYIGGDLKLYLLEYNDRTLEDGKLMENNSNYTISEDGHYYFLLVNKSKKTSSTNIEVAVQTQIN